VPRPKFFPGMASVTWTSPEPKKVDTTRLPSLPFILLFYFVYFAYSILFYSNKYSMVWCVFNFFIASLFIALIFSKGRWRSIQVKHALHGYINNCLQMWYDVFRNYGICTIAFVAVFKHSSNTSNLDIFIVRACCC
jgi:hypothetical protein